MSFVDSPDNAIDLSYVVCHENHNKYYFFTDTGELKSAPFSTFPICTKVIICKDKHLHIPMLKLEGSRRDTPNIRYANEDKDKVHSK